MTARNRMDSGNALHRAAREKHGYGNDGRTACKRRPAELDVTTETRDVTCRACRKAIAPPLGAGEGGAA